MFARSTDPRSAWISWPRLSVRGFLGRLVAMDAAHRQHLALGALDDRMLRDIGVTRADVAAELRQPKFF